MKAYEDAQKATKKASVAQPCLSSELTTLSSGRVPLSCNSLRGKYHFEVPGLGVQLPEAAHSLALQSGIGVHH